MNSTLQGVATDVSSIKEVVTDLKNSVNAIQERLDEAEGRISNMEDITSKLVGDGERHDKRLEVMWNRIEDLENRSRRNNVRMIGLKERLEAGGMIKCVYKILSEGWELIRMESLRSRGRIALSFLGPMLIDHLE